MPRAASPAHTSTAGAARLGVSPQACLVVEDAPAGVQAGAAAGCQVAAVAHTHACAALTDAAACFEDLPSLLAAISCRT